MAIQTLPEEERTLADEESLYKNGYTEEEFQKKQNYVAKEWQEYIKKVMKQDPLHQATPDKEMNSFVSNFVTMDKKTGGIKLKSPHKDGATFLYKKSYGKNMHGKYNASLVYNKRTNEGKKFDQQAADDLVNVGIATMGWKELKFNNCSKKNKEMMWIAAQKINADALIEWELAGNHPKDFKNKVEVANFEGSEKSQEQIFKYLKDARIEKGLLTADQAYGPAPQNTDAVLKQREEALIQKHQEGKINTPEISSAKELHSMVGVAIGKKQKDLSSDEIKKLNEAQKGGQKLLDKLETGLKEQKKEDKAFYAKMKRDNNILRLQGKKATSPEDKAEIAEARKANAIAIKERRNAFKEKQKEVNHVKGIMKAIRRSTDDTVSAHGIHKRHRDLSIADKEKLHNIEKEEKKFQSDLKKKMKQDRKIESKFCKITKKEINGLKMDAQLERNPSFKKIVTEGKARVKEDNLKKQTLDNLIKRQKQQEQVKASKVRQKKTKKLSI